jgi:hypothetical protein
MKNLMLLILLSATSIFTSQAQTSFAKDSLSVSSFISFQKKVDFENYQIEFKNVVSDSRCPKDVMCIRAGEAKVLLSIFKNGAYIEDKEITIDANGYVMEENNLAFITNDFKIFGMNLKPYPTSKASISETDYEIEIVFQPTILN